MDIRVFSATPNAVAGPAVIARCANELGFDSYWIPDHPILAVGDAKNYPGAPRKEEGGSFFGPHS